MQKNDNRWWEYYLARYIAANIFAVLVLFYLVFFEGQTIKESLCQDRSSIALCAKTTVFSNEVFSFIFVTSKKVESINNTKSNMAAYESGFILNKDSKIDVTEINFANIFVLGVFGFLYMYISSLPIYFLHITRGVWLDIVNVNKNKKTAPCSCCFLYLCKLLQSTNLVIISFVLVLFLALVKPDFAPLPLLLLLFRLEVIHDYLRKSTIKRDQIESKEKEIKIAPFYRNNHFNKGFEKLYSPEYITSYKHAREHGNAFGTILMEILFALFLIHSKFSIFAIVCWLLLGFSGWLIGILLESKMVSSDI